MFIVFEEHVLSSEGDGRHFLLYIMTFRAQGWTISSEASDICIRNDSESASLSLSSLSGNSSFDALPTS